MLRFCHYINVDVDLNTFNLSMLFEFYVKSSRKHKKGKSKRHSAKKKHNLSRNQDNEEMQFKDVREIFKNDGMPTLFY